MMSFIVGHKEQVTWRSLGTQSYFNIALVHTPFTAYNSKQQSCILTDYYSYTSIIGYRQITQFPSHGVGLL